MKSLGGIDIKVGSVFELLDYGDETGCKNFGQLKKFYQQRIDKTKTYQNNE